MSELPYVPGAADALAERFWNDLLELSPILATTCGLEAGNDRLDDPGPAGREQARLLFGSTLAEAMDLSAHDGPIDTEERITLDLLRVICEVNLEQLDQRIDRLRVIDQAEGPQTILPTLASLQPTDTPERFERYLARVYDYPRFMAANAEVVREGLATGLTAARILTERVIGQLERLLALAPEEAPIVGLVAAPTERDRERLVTAVRDAVRPADAAFLEALRGPYLAASRDDPGLHSAPEGEQLYRTQARAWTTLGIDPREVHRIGLEELASIEGERRVIARSLGFGDDTTAARRALTTGPGAVPATEEEYLERARALIARALEAAPGYFGRLPSSGIEVRAVEPYKQADAPFAYYFQPSSDGSRPGVYWLNPYRLQTRTYMQLAPTSFHEAVPGHHLQIALETENTSLNDFRRLGARLAGTAYTEGWGLYAERLADEMGLYESEAERFGMLDAQSWRAARLVVDSGIHALGWTRQQAIEQLLASGLSETDAVIETDRYIAWPGQALTYKLGQREIERLRREISAALGPRFDLRAFHDALLGHGTLPLATLARELPVRLGAAD